MLGLFWVMAIRLDTHGTRTYHEGRFSLFFHSMGDRDITRKAYDKPQDMTWGFSSRLVISHTEYTTLEAAATVDIHCSELVVLFCDQRAMSISRIQQGAPQPASLPAYPYLQTVTPGLDRHLLRHLSSRWLVHCTTATVMQTVGGVPKDEQDRFVWLIDKGAAARALDPANPRPLCTPPAH